MILQVIILANTFAAMGLVGAMAPKRKAKDKGEADTSRADQQNMINQLKAARTRLASKTSLDAATDEKKVAMLETYQSLNLRDPKKNEMLLKWKADKSLQWWGNYQETHSVGTVRMQEEYEGYGTKCFACIIISCRCVITCSCQSTIFNEEV